MTRTRWRIQLQGVVQGVGMRPTIYQLATDLGLVGFVANTTHGVTLELEGPLPQLERFRARFPQALPPHATIHLMTVDTIPCFGLTSPSHSAEVGFTIVPSQVAPHGLISAIPADLATCVDCVREFHDPSDPRYHYPFLNCTHCGPRYTIIETIPYDRAGTTMAQFQMCSNCQREYDDPRNRRFHAQPIACPQCGPSLWLEVDGLACARHSEAITQAQLRLQAGEILAVKGIGGFHLVCDATQPTAIAELRQRKGRVGKPFAVMFRNLNEVRRYAEVNETEAALLTSSARPIVLLRCHHEGMRLADGVAPGQNGLGVMLPYAPLHEWLLTSTPLVMTSGNRSEEPIAHDNAEARERLGDLADAFLMHDRPIVMACDDSVVRVWQGQAYPIRRARGYVPQPVALPESVPSVLAVGAELKAAVCFTRDRYALLSQHLGDMGNWESLQALEMTAAHLERLFQVTPTKVVCDSHPGYLSAAWALRLAQTRKVPIVTVQHHHAHVVALRADAGLWDPMPILGVCWDGTGYGTDGAIWGGELLRTWWQTYERVAHLRYVPLPGGDQAILHPYRMALAHLWAAGIPWDADLPAVQACPIPQRALLQRQLERNLGCVATSSMGRLFDAAAALLGLRTTITYEAEAALALEALVDATLGRELLWGQPNVLADVGTIYGFALGDSLPLVIDPTPLWTALIADYRRGLPSAVIATKLHCALAQLVVDLTARIDPLGTIPRVGLTGGVFQNLTLLEMIRQQLDRKGRIAVTHRQVPCNDGGLSLGQTLVGCGFASDVFPKNVGKNSMFVL